jgi:hypothetical protein
LAVAAQVLEQVAVQVREALLLLARFAAQQEAAVQGTAVVSVVLATQTTQAVRVQTDLQQHPQQKARGAVALHHLIRLQWEQILNKAILAVCLALAVGVQPLGLPLALRQQELPTDAAVAAFLFVARAATAKAVADREGAYQLPASRD